MTFFRFVFFCRALVPLSARGLATTTVSTTASAEAPEAANDTHHVEALLALAFAPRGQDDHPACPADGACLPAPRRFPPGDIGYGLRVGYRFRPEVSFHGDGQYFTLPLMLYGRLPLGSGTSLMLGVGGGVAHARGEADAHQTDAFLRVELGAVILVSGPWSVQILANGSGGVHTFSQTPVDVFGNHERLKWGSLAFGPRYSF